MKHFRAALYVTEATGVVIADLEALVQRIGNKGVKVIAGTISVETLVRLRNASMIGILLIEEGVPAFVPWAIPLPFAATNHVLIAMDTATFTNCVSLHAGQLLSITTVRAVPLCTVATMPTMFWDLRTSAIAALCSFVPFIVLFGCLRIRWTKCLLQVWVSIEVALPIASLVRARSGIQAVRARENAPSLFDHADTKRGLHNHEQSQKTHHHASKHDRKERID